MRDPQGKEGVHHGPVPTKTQSLFSSQNFSSGRQALLQVTRIFEQKRRKEGRKEGNE